VLRVISKCVCVCVCVCVRVCVYADRWRYHLSGGIATCPEGGRRKGRRKGRVREEVKEGGERLLERHNKQLV
jgi:hypothetical protein